MFFLRVVGVWGGGGEKEREGGREGSERETESRERGGGGRKRWVVCEAKQDGGVAETAFEVFWAVLQKMLPNPNSTKLDQTNTKYLVLFFSRPSAGCVAYEYFWSSLVFEP
jgi:hypothetical protein